MKTILLIEDDPFLVEIYTTKLRGAGYKVNLTNNVEDALRKTREAKPDLVVLDIVLPKLDGWEFLKAIRQDSQFKDLKVVILSNLGQKEEIDKGVGLGAIKYFIKAEHTPSEVMEEIKEILK